MIYHITTLKGWREAQQRGEYWAESLETEGFVHCSTETQVPHVVEKYFKGQRGLLLLEIDPTILTADLKWEPPSGEVLPSGVSDLFPHVYGPINLNAIVKFRDVNLNPA